MIKLIKAYPSAIPFLATAFVFLLQTFPFPGVLLMMLGAAWWSVFFVNLGFLWIAFDGVRGALPRWALLLPTLWFGGYYVALGLSYMELRELVSEIATANESSRLSFDQNTNQLVLEPQVQQFIPGEELLDNYNLPVIYNRKPYGGSCGAFESVSLTTEQCLPSRQQTYTGPPQCLSNSERVSLREVETRGKRVVTHFVPLDGVCHKYEWRNPSLPTVTVSAEKPASPSWLVGGRLETFEIRRGSEAPPVVRSGYVSRLAWFPKPLLGCALVSSSPSWNCAAMFAHGERTKLGEAADVIVAALGLTPVALEERYPEAKRMDLSSRKQLPKTR